MDDKTRLLLEMVLEFVRSEPELPGDMPEELKLIAKAEPELFARAAVRTTKKSIERRIKDNWGLR